MNFMTEAPPDIVEASQKILNWMTQQGATHWALGGICSRASLELAERVRLLETKRANALEARVHELEGAYLATEHTVKCWPQFFIPLQTGAKPFEIRLDDRGYKMGDFLIEKEWNPDTKEYTGQELKFRITYIMRGPTFGLAEGWVIMGIRKI